MGIRNSLVGKTITGYELEPGGGSLRLDILGGDPVVLEVEGECCSDSWIESIDDDQALLGTVTDVEHIEMPDSPDRPPHPEDEYTYRAYYGLKITTNRGRCVIDYRNDSNGYYGGWIYVQGDRYGD